MQIIDNLNSKTDFVSANETIKASQHNELKAF